MVVNFKGFATFGLTRAPLRAQTRIFFLWLYELMNLRTMKMLDFGRQRASLTSSWWHGVIFYV
mgnify:CR=1 FL=1